MATYTEDWRPNTYEKGPDNYRGVRKFVVIDAANPFAALAATLEGGSETLPTINDTYPDDTRLKCDRVTPSAVGPTTYEVVATYSIPEDGDRHTGTGAGIATNNDVLLEPPTINFSTVEETVAIEEDVDGNPIVNSAGNPFESPPTKVITYKEMVVTRNESFFNLAQSNEFERKVNNAPVRLWGFGLIAAGKMICLSILPENDITPEATIIRVQYRFQIKFEGAAPHQLRLLDLGYNSLIDVDGTTKQVPIRDANKVVIQSPVLLNGSGAPYSPSQYNIGGTPANETPDGAITDDTGTAVFLRYDRYGVEDYDKLKLFPDA